jgi:hypothetical protein
MAAHSSSLLLSDPVTKCSFDELWQLLVTGMNGVAAAELAHRCEWQGKTILSNIEAKCRNITNHSFLVKITNILVSNKVITESKKDILEMELLEKLRQESKVESDEIQRAVKKRIDSLIAELKNVGVIYHAMKQLELVHVHDGNETKIDDATKIGDKVKIKVAQAADGKTKSMSYTMSETTNDDVAQSIVTSGQFIPSSLSLSSVTTSPVTETKRSNVVKDRHGSDVSCIQFCCRDSTVTTSDELSVELNARVPTVANIIKEVEQFNKKYPLPESVCTIKLENITNTFEFNTMVLLFKVIGLISKQTATKVCVAFQERKLKLAKEAAEAKIRHDKECAERVAREARIQAILSTPDAELADIRDAIDKKIGKKIDNSHWNQDSQPVNYYIVKSSPYASTYLIDEYSYRKMNQINRMLILNSEDTGSMD